MSSIEVDHQLSGWGLYWVRVEADPEADLSALCGEVAERARRRFADQPLAQHPTAAAIRRLFRAAGCDPTRYRPSSEALLRRLLGGAELPLIHPLVDLNNCLSVDLVVPSCVMAEGSFEAPVVLRAGEEGETYESLRGPFNLAGKPVLADARGPFGTPITDSERVKVGPGTRRGWLVAYLPEGVVAPEQASSALAGLSKGGTGVRRLW